jgi:hypothetical protein
MRVYINLSEYELRRMRNLFHLRSFHACVFMLAITFMSRARALSTVSELPAPAQPFPAHHTCSHFDQNTFVIMVWYIQASRE